MSSVIKNMTVVALKAAAKARGFKGYYKLRKADLLKLFDDSNIMDALIPEIRDPVIIPSAYVPVSFVQKVYDKTKTAVNTFANWIMSYMLPIEPKKIVNERVEKLKANVNTIFNKLFKKILKFEKVSRLSKDFQNNIQLIELKDLILYHFLVRYNHM